MTLTPGPEFSLQPSVLGIMLFLFQKALLSEEFIRYSGRPSKYWYIPLLLNLIVYFVSVFIFRYLKHVFLFLMGIEF